MQLQRAALRVVAFLRIPRVPFLVVVIVTPMLEARPMRVRVLRTGEGHLTSKAPLYHIRFGLVSSFIHSPIRSYSSFPVPNLTKHLCVLAPSVALAGFDYWNMWPVLLVAVECSLLCMLSFYW